MTEDELVSCVIDLAHLFRWRVVHFRPARTAYGWRTAFTGDAGFPDLVLARDRTIFAELKSSRGRLTVDQELWQDVLLAANAEWYLWRPDDWTTGEIERVLR